MNHNTSGSNNPFAVVDSRSNQAQFSSMTSLPVARSAHLGRQHSFQGNPQPMTHARPQQSPSGSNHNLNLQASTDLTNIDPALGSLPSLAEPSNAPADHPLVRFYSGVEDPWVPGRNARHLGIPGSTSRPPYPASQPPMTYGHYRSGPSSEVESNDHGPIPSDSGYVTYNRTSNSVHSGDPEYFDDCHGLPNDVCNLQPFIGAGAAEGSEVSFPSRRQRQKNRNSESLRSKQFEDAFRIHKPSARKAQPDKCLDCPVEGCPERPKCRSDLKKHMDRHDKPYRCELPDCKREGVGFTTPNDLGRHQKSVHKSGDPSKSFRCAGRGCKNPHKLWPRYDNFKQHVSRMHKDEEMDDLINRSRCEKMAPPSPNLQTSIAPMDTTLAGMDDHSRHPQVNVSSSPSSFSFPSLDQGYSRYDIGLNPQSLGREEAQQPLDGQHIHPGLSHYDEPPMDPTISPMMQGKHEDSQSNDFLTQATAGLDSPDLQMASPPSTGPRSVQPSSRKDPHAEATQRALNQMSTAIADKIRRESNGQSLSDTIYRVLTSAAGFHAPSFSNNASALDMAGNKQQTTTILSQQEADEGPPEAVLDFMSQEEVRAGLSALAKLMKRQPGKRNIHSSRRNLGAGAKGKHCERCEHDDFSRPCDKRKHMKRHYKPYGCTFPNCNKPFGSKSDWKRHENSQHFQVETFRCQFYIKPYPNQDSSTPDPTRQCGRLFFRPEQFRKHLNQEHNPADETLTITQQVKEWRIGRNGQSKFWCGFCKDILPLEKRRAQAWDERFNHIDEHFKKGQNITEWWCLEAKKTKAEVAKDKDRHSFSDHEEQDHDAQSEDEETSSPGCQDPVDKTEIDQEAVTVEPHQGHAEASVPEIHVTPSPTNTRKRKRVDSSENYEIFTYCCQCQSGPFARKLYESCLYCQHGFRKCSSCVKKAYEGPSFDELDFDIYSY